MNAFLLELLNMSLVASLLIVAVVLLRFVLRKAPKAIICVLWALVGLRLICPFSFESRLSLVPDAEPITHISEFDADDITEKPVYKEVVSFETSEGSVVVRTEDTTQFDFVGFLMKLAPYIWVGGVLLMAASSVISYIRLRKNMLICVNKEGNIWLCDSIKSPFILGIIKPKIYIPSHLSEEEQAVVIAHEKAHLKRFDHLWKPFGYLILTIHWFNPLVWVAYALLCRDIEGACDERVVKDMNLESKKLYSETLLACSAPRHMLAACPVAFGEVSVKGRIKSVLSYKKPAFWIIIAAVAASAAVAVFFMTNPIKAQAKIYSTETELLNKTILMENENEGTEDFFAAESHEILQRDTQRDFITYYLLVFYGEYSGENETVELGGSSHYYPAVITAERTTDGKYEMLEYWTAEDKNGEAYTDSIKEKFPAKLHDKVIYGVSYKNTLSKACEKEASEYFGIEKTVKADGDYPRFVGEILSSAEEYYLVAPLDGETILGVTIEKVYVSRNAKYGGDVDFIRGDYIYVTYEEILEDSEPPILPSVESISLRSKVFTRIYPYEVDFYHEYHQDNTSAFACVDTTQENLENLKIYRYAAETPLPPEDFPEEATYIYNDRFAPYILLDYSTGFANFAYSEDYILVGLFEEKDGKLVINGFTYSNQYYPYVTNQDGDVYIFNITREGYAFDEENSEFLDTYRYRFDGKVYESLPDGAVFKNDFDLEVK